MDPIDIPHVSLPRASRLSSFPIRASNSMAIIRRHASSIDRKFIYSFRSNPSFLDSLGNSPQIESIPSLPSEPIFNATRRDRTWRREFEDPSFFLRSRLSLSLSRFLVFSTSYITPTGFIEKPPTLSAVRETGYKLRGKTQYGRSTFGRNSFLGMDNRWRNEKGTGSFAGSRKLLLFPIGPVTFPQRLNEKPFLLSFDSLSLSISRPISSSASIPLDC